MSPLVLSLGVPLMLRLVLMMLRPILRRLLRPTRLSLRPTASTESDHRKNLTLASIPVPETSHQPFDPYRPAPSPSAGLLKPLAGLLPHPYGLGRPYRWKRLLYQGIALYHQAGLQTACKGGDTSNTKLLSRQSLAVMATGNESRKLPRL